MSAVLAFDRQFLMVRNALLMNGLKCFQVVNSAFLIFDFYVTVLGKVKPESASEISLNSLWLKNLIERDNKAYGLVQFNIC